MAPGSTMAGRGRSSTAKRSSITCQSISHLLRAAHRSPHSRDIHCKKGVNRMVYMITRYPVLSYCALVVVWSFTWWSLILTAVPIGTLFEPPMNGAAVIYMILGGVGPSLIGLILTHIVDGRGSVRALLAGLGQWHVGW